MTLQDRAILNKQIPNPGSVTVLYTWRNTRRTINYGSIQHAKTGLAEWTNDPRVSKIKIFQQEK